MPVHSKVTKYKISLTASWHTPEASRVSPKYALMPILLRIHAATYEMGYISSSTNRARVSSNRPAKTSSHAKKSVQNCTPFRSLHQSTTPVKTEYRPLLYLQDAFQYKSHCTPSGNRALRAAMQMLTQPKNRPRPMRVAHSNNRSFNIADIPVRIHENEKQLRGKSRPGFLKEGPLLGYRHRYR